MSGFKKQAGPSFFFEGTLVMVSWVVQRATLLLTISFFRGGVPVLRHTQRAEVWRSGWAPC